MLGSWETFLIAQIFGLIGCVFSYIRMQQDNWRAIHLYHTVLCIPLAIHFSLVGAFFAASLCVVGGLRTLALSTDWGFERKIQIVFICLCIPAMGTYWTTTHWLDWLLLATTILGVGAEGQNCILKLRICSLINAVTWLLNGLFFGAYMGALLSVSAIVSNLKAMRTQFGNEMSPQRLRQAHFRIHFFKKRLSPETF